VIYIFSDIFSDSLSILSFCWSTSRGVRVAFNARKQRNYCIWPAFAIAYMYTHTRVEALIASTQIYRLKLYGNWPARHAAPATSECYDGVPAPVARRDRWTPISERERTLGDHTGYHLPFSAIMLAENVKLRFTDVYLSDFTGD